MKLMPNECLNKVNLSGVIGSAQLYDCFSAIIEIFNTSWRDYLYVYTEEISHRQGGSAWMFHYPNLEDLTMVSTPYNDDDDENYPTNFSFNSSWLIHW